MGERNTGAQAGAISPVELKEIRRRRVVESFCTPLHDVFADPTGTEEVAFQGQKRQLVERVDQAERTTEFKAVDNDRGIGETDMLRPQIAVAFDDTAML